ncbi:aminoacyl--tRNA ligase-related protein [Clostridium sp. DJ247]|uniref:aminoacyl--tRNA ligase-related protein n=1 Tax=Clostridium sp. DJ247 TaxID=2726188 RepID=UPI001F4C7B32|nr:aminoacyl--tRNA ligase-related protein [Clostridium sp. DJ247]MBC2580389.1 hypothetical protein [Clostridium sp. DJ247]
MSKINYNISAFSGEQKKFFKEMISYVSEHIVDFKFFDNEVEIQLQDEKYLDIVLKNINQLRDMINSNELKKGQELKIKTIYKNSNKDTINKEPIFETLIEQGDVIQIMPGIFAYSGLFKNVYGYFLKKVREFIKIEFPEHKDIQFPKLYPLKQFEQGGYFDNFPHHIMFQSVLRNDINTINDFSKNGVTDDFLKNIKTPTSVLKNASCVPVYSLIADSTILESEGLKSFFVKGKCFRNEGANITELARLNEFTMAEFVFIGTDELIGKAIERSKKLWYFWSDVFNLDCSIETANDSFFAGNYNKLKYFQLLGNSKEEFKILLPHSNTYIAASSANYHRTHFTKRYNIKSDQGFSHSSCFAFGIERLAYALLCQKGIDVSRWDKETLAEIEKYVSIKK